MGLSVLKPFTVKVTPKTHCAVRIGIKLEIGVEVKAVSKKKKSPFQCVRKAFHILISREIFLVEANIVKAVGDPPSPSPSPSRNVLPGTTAFHANCRVPSNEGLEID